MSIEAKISNPNKRIRKAKKDTSNAKDIRTNYILGNFKNDLNREKLFSDTTEFRTPKGKKYFSTVVGTNKNLYSLTVSSRNYKTLIMKDIQRCIKKVGRKLFIQFDNAAFYENDDMKKILVCTKELVLLGYQEIQNQINQLKTFDQY